jgi:cytosine/adenosine deaminase-related metal-dependent hydrolase
MNTPRALALVLRFTAAAFVLVFALLFLASVTQTDTPEFLYRLFAWGDVGDATTIAPSGNRSLPLARLADAGVRVGLGQDGMRDYWSPFGDADMLSRTWQLAITQQLRRDRDIERCLAVATLGGRTIVQLGTTQSMWTDDPDDLPGFGIGEPADFVLLPGETVTSAIMDRPHERVVIHAGGVVAQDGSLSSS